MVLTKTISDFQKLDFLRLTLNLTYSNKCILNCMVYKYSRIHTILIYKTVKIVVIAFCRKMQNVCRRERNNKYKRTIYLHT